MSTREVFYGESKRFRPVYRRFDGVTAAGLKNSSVIRPRNVR
jgi:hypothetical protein